MDKILRFFPHFLLFSYLLRTVLCTPSLPDALIIIVLGSIYAFEYYLNSKREPEANKDLREQIKKLKEEHESVKSKVSSLTIAGAIRK